MRAPSLYTHFPSKMAIYDAMFEHGWQDYLAAVADIEPKLPVEPRRALAKLARHFFDFAIADPARCQLMNQRMVPGFEPTAKAYAPAIDALDRLRAALAKLGVADKAGVDMYTALVGGLVNQQLANDPGGRRWRRLLDRAVDMYADEFGLPGPRISERGKR
jgi:AcrR family transcriptional regulator